MFTTRSILSSSTRIVTDEGCLAAARASLPLPDASGRGGDAAGAEGAAAMGAGGTAGAGATGAGATGAAATGAAGCGAGSAMGMGAAAAGVMSVSWNSHSAATGAKIDSISCLGDSVSSVPLQLM